ncbi:cystine/glutamate transporter-like [Diadema setosum]|uniref:cystine/glutamate transporter-like n=1 Tax=Diadema setosum TaxID=31175 RepID=UPI003B3BB412
MMPAISSRMMSSYEMDSYPLLQEDDFEEDMIIFRRNPPASSESDYRYRQLRNIQDDSEKEEDGEEEKIAIPRHLGLAGCVWYIIGQVIGTGIFITPSGVLRGTGSSVGWALVIWVLCGIIQFCGALVYAELSLIMHKSGGDFTFLLQAWGPVIGFCRLWVSTIINPSSLAIQSLVIAKYLLTPFFQCVEEPLLAVRLISICCILFLVFINCISVKFSTKLTGFLTLTKTFGLFVIFISGIYNLANGHTEYLANGFSSGRLDVTLLPMGFFSGLYSFSGWEIITTITEEIHKPARNIPLSLFISMTAITAVYLMANIAYFTLLSPAQMLSSGAVAADYSVLALGSWSWLVWIFVAMSACGSANASILARSRTTFAAAREGLFPEIFSMVSIKHRTPLPSVVILLIALIYLVEDDVIVLIEYTQFVDIMFILLTCFILPYYRWKYPHIPRPFKIPLFVVVIYTSAMIFILGMSLYSDPVGKGIGICIVLTGLPIYFAFVHPRYRMKCLGPFSLKLTRVLQRLFFCIHQEKETF